MSELHTPNLDKARGVNEISNAQGDFVRWLQDHGVTVRDENEHGLTDFRLNKLLAEYHEIDYDEMERERDRVYQAISASAQTKRFSVRDAEIT